MNFSFLLRFQEKCEVASELDVVNAGTQTKTAIPKEQPDPTAPNFLCLPNVENNLGTMTLTRIANEQGDADYESTARTIPLRQIIGTKTATAIKMESADQAPSHYEIMTIPKCSS